MNISRVIHDPAATQTAPRTVRRWTLISPCWHPPIAREAHPGPRRYRPAVPGVLHRGRGVVLRRPSARDRDGFLDLIESSRRVHRGWVEPPADAEEFTDWVRRGRRPDFEAFLVCVAETGEIAGATNLGQILRGGFQNAYLGYYGFTPTARRGHMTEGVRLTLKHAFTTMALHRVEANVQPDNARSIALVERCGFRQEGFSPRYLKIGGRWRDHVRYAVTVEDWRRHKAGRVQE
jgi:ribosomal-protein-alanine N-acetyltransferase